MQQKVQVPEGYEKAVKAVREGIRFIEKTPGLGKAALMRITKETNVGDGERCPLALASGMLYAAAREKYGIQKAYFYGFERCEKYSRDTLTGIWQNFAKQWQGK